MPVTLEVPAGVMEFPGIRPSQEWRRLLARYNSDRVSAAAAGVHMPEIRTIRLAAADGPPNIEITIGQAQFGKYELSLFDTDGRNPVVVGSGLSHDQLPDAFQIDGDPRALNARFLSWSANIIPAGDEPDPRFSLRVNVRQQGADVPGSPIESAGPLPGPHVEFGFVKLEVV
jgi:hypothetical protein